MSSVTEIEDVDVAPEAEADGEAWVEPELEVNSSVLPASAGLLTQITAEAENEADPEMLAQAEAEPMPSVPSVTVPTVLLLLLMCAGLTWLVFSRRRHSRKQAMKWRKLKTLSDGYLTKFDVEVIESLHSFTNSPKDLAILSLPAIISICLAPVTLFLYPPLSAVLWPDHSSPPNINDAIACFLMPAGLVYATAFASAFSAATEKLNDIQSQFLKEVSMLDQILTLSAKLHLTVEQKMAVYKATKSETIYMMLQVMDRDVKSFKNKAVENFKIHIWEIIDILRNLDGKDLNHVSQIMINHIMDHIINLSSICSDNGVILKARIHPIKWAFLETLGFFSFFGVVLIKTQSNYLSLGICMITVFSISILCYVIADLDNPFSGFFHLDLSILELVLIRGISMYTTLKQLDRGDHALQQRELCGYDVEQVTVSQANDIQNIVQSKNSLTGKNQEVQFCNGKSTCTENSLNAEDCDVYVGARQMLHVAQSFTRTNGMINVVSSRVNEKWCIPGQQT